MLAAPGVIRPSFAEVVISDTRTAGVALQDETNADGVMKATLTSTGSVSVTGTSGKYGLWGNADGWDITVEEGATINVSYRGLDGTGIYLRENAASGNYLSGTITNSGTIAGVFYGISAGSLKLVNDSTGIIECSDNGSSAVNTNSGGNDITNRGSISGNGYGVFLSGSGNTLTNSGTITGRDGISVYVRGGGTILNEEGGVLKSTSSNSTDAAVSFGSAAEGTVTNKGEITGPIGVIFAGTGADILDNSGTITGTSGTAVNMGAGNDTAYLRDGSAITGAVAGGDGTDTIHLEGSGTITTGTITGWETVRKSGDGTWSLGGDLSSGNNISVLGGALKVSGAYTHEAGATYTVGAGSDGKAGKVTADTAVLNGGAVSVVTKGLKGGTHTIIETTNGLTGTFDSVTSDSKYREMSLAYDAKNSYLNMRSNFKKSGARGTRGNVASAIDDAYSNSSSDDMVTVVDELFSLDDGALNSALDQISGTTHSVSSTVAPARQGAFYQNLFGRTGSTTGLGFLGLNDRQSDPLTMLASGGPVASDAGFTLTRDGQKLPYGMWIKGYGVTGNRHGDDVGSRYDYTIGGAIAGFDYLINPNIRAGVAVGYSKTSVDMKQLQDNSDVESFQGSIYGSYVPKSKLWYVDAAFGYSKNSYETKRYLNFGNIYRVARGSYDGSDISGYLEGGYKVPVFCGITATPLVSFLAMRNHTDSFTETGAGALNLESDSNNTDSYQSGVGVKLSREFKAAKDFALTPEFGAKWLHEFGDTEANINARFAGETAGSFVITSSTAKRDAGVFSLNLTGKKSDMLSFFVGYDLGITEDQISHGFTGGLRFNW